MEYDLLKKHSFVCYFCNKEIRNETELGHTTVCGNVLIPCSNKCGAYVAQMDYQKHKKECPNKSTRIKNEQKVIRNEQEQPKSTSDEFRNISAKLVAIERKCVENAKNQMEIYKNSQIQTKLDLGKLEYQYQIFHEWKKNIEFQMENFRRTHDSFDMFRRQMDFHLENFHKKIISLEKLQKDIDLQSESLLQEQKFVRSMNREMNDKLDGFKDFFTQENALVAALWNDQKQNIEKNQDKIDGIIAEIDEQKSKVAGINFEVKTTSRIATDSVDKLEIMQNNLDEMQKQITQLTLDFSILEESLEENLAIQAIANSPGHLIWRINNFTENLQKAKEFDAVMKSPVFYTHNYGYKIRVLLFLNGLKKWKDRYALISIGVLKGHYDMLLNWPCHIEGSIVLKDLDNLAFVRIFTFNPREISEIILAEQFYEIHHSQTAETQRRDGGTPRIFVILHFYTAFHAD